jgi:hypothetical protein
LNRATLADGVLARAWHNDGMRRFSWVLVAPIVAVACGQSFSAGSVDAGGSAEGGPPDGSGEAAGCTPKTCPQQDFACGLASDGCGKALDCGPCLGSNVTCDVMHQCKCEALTCGTIGAQCGTFSDGCGGTLDCGTCGTGLTCGAGGMLKCGNGTCTPTTCAAQGAQCGQIDDDCGNVIQCPDNCTAPDTCAGGGKANQCGCTPQTCATLGWQCGGGDDGCRGALDCGACDGGPCNENAHSCSCTPAQTCASLGYGCGSFTDTCGAVELCGPPPIIDPTSGQCSNGPLPAFYACCLGVVVGMGGQAADGNPVADAGGTCNPLGATPPEPGWDCAATNQGSGNGWCCAK